jgi:gluconate 2-dehydrogenase alpha chain
MATKLKPVDAVTIGVGLTGTILAQELAATGLKVVGIERRRWRDTDHDFAMPGVHDELYVRNKERVRAGPKTTS